MPKPYPQEFRDDVVRVARDRGDGVSIERVAKDFGVHPMTLTKWMRRADIDAELTWAYRANAPFDAHREDRRVRLSVPRWRSRLGRGINV